MRKQSAKQSRKKLFKDVVIVASLAAIIRAMYLLNQSMIFSPTLLENL